VVQYGVTRERLAEIAGSGDGWDVLHLSGHGAGGLFLLEKADGSPDRVGTADLVDLLRAARRRVKLAVVSACESAGDTTAQTLRLIGYWRRSRSCAR
jgi:CHAT domain-containing protein